MTPRRRAQSLPSEHSYELGSAASDTSSTSKDHLHRLHIRQIVQPSQTTVRHPGSGSFLNAIRAARFVQLLFGLALIAINAILLARYRTLRDDCSPVNMALDCQIYSKAVGAFGYCIFPGVLGILQGVWGMRATFVDPLPLHTVIGLDNIVAGFHMGGGCVSGPRERS